MQCSIFQILNKLFQDGQMVFCRCAKVVKFGHTGFIKTFEMMRKRSQVISHGAQWSLVQS